MRGSMSHSSNTAILLRVLLMLSLVDPGQLANLRVAGTLPLPEACLMDYLEETKMIQAWISEGGDDTNVRETKKSYTIFLHHIVPPGTENMTEANRVFMQTIVEFGGVQFYLSHLVDNGLYGFKIAVSVEDVVLEQQGYFINTCIPYIPDVNERCNETIPTIQYYGINEADLLYRACRVQGKGSRDVVLGGYCQKSSVCLPTDSVCIDNSCECPGYMQYNETFIACDLIGGYPHLSIGCIENCRGWTDPLTDFTLEFLCKDCGTLFLSYEWELELCRNRRFKRCKDVMSWVTTTNKDLVFDSGTLTPAAYYKLNLKVVLNMDMTLTANRHIKVSQVPVGGSCQVEPSTGQSLLTKYSVGCSGFSLDSNVQHLSYQLYTSDVPDPSLAGLFFKDSSPNRTNLYLQQGDEQTNYTLYLYMRGVTESGSYVSYTFSTQVMPPFHDEEGSEKLDLLGGMVFQNASTGSSQVEDIIENGDSSGAAQVLGIVTDFLNKDAESGTSPGANDTDVEEEKDKRKEIRTTVIKTAEKLDVDSVEKVQQVAEVLTGATEVKDELTEEAQEVATNLYSSLAELIEAQTENATTEENTSVVRTVLNGVSRLLELSVDRSKQQLEDTCDPETSTELPANQTALVATEKAKNATEKIFKTLEHVTNALLDISFPGKNVTVMKTETVTVRVEKIKANDLLGKTLSDEGNTSSSFSFPNETNILDGFGDVGIEMLVLKSNPFTWDESAMVVTPVLRIMLKDNKNNVIPVSHLEQPVTFSFTLPEPGDGDCDNYIYGVSGCVIQDGGSFSYDGSNVFVMNFTTIENKTTMLELELYETNVAVKFYLKTQEKPSLEEVLAFGVPLNQLTGGDLPDNLYLAETYSARQEGKGAGATILIQQASTGAQNVSDLYFLGVVLDLSDPDTLLFVERQSQLYGTSCTGDGVCCVRNNVSLRIRTSALTCLFWDEDHQIWASDGCEVSRKTTQDRLHCACSHMTSFGGGILVLPNFVDPLMNTTLFMTLSATGVIILKDPTLTMTLSDNSIVLATVVLLWTVYLILLYWARKMDKQDISKRGVVVCRDNVSTYTYGYLVCLVTGWWKQGGTTSTVYMYLTGASSNSFRRCLTTTARRCFQTGAEDWFLLTTEDSLGELKSVTVWHDNSGTSPKWYLNQIYVRDLQTQEAWYFMYNDWLALDRGSLLMTHTTIPALRDTDFNKKQKHHFLMKSSRGLRDSHLWISIFCKRPGNRFTRAQRVTCCLSLLLTTMLTNIMFYGIPTDDPSDQVGTSSLGISISLATVMIGLESSLIMFPVNVLIVQLFRYTAPRDANSASRVKESSYMKKLYSLGTAVTGVIQRLRRSDGSFVKLGGTCTRNTASSTCQRKGLLSYEEDVAMGNQRLSAGMMSQGAKRVSTSGRQLPWWCLYVAWVIVLSVCLVSSYFVILYGLKYGYQLSIEWLVSFLCGFSQSALVIQPLKVVSIALVFTLVLKKTVKFDDYGPHEELDEDEEYLREVSAGKEKKQAFIKPLSKRLMMEIRKRVNQDWMMNKLLWDTFLYLIFLFIFLLTVYGHRNITMDYRSNRAIENMLDISKEDESSFYEVDTVEAMFDYLKETIVPSLSEMSGMGTAQEATPSSNIVNHYLLVPYRLRQLRIKSDSCMHQSSAVFKKFNFELPPCVGDYWISDEETTNYNHSWTQPSQETLSKPDEWTYQTQWQLKTIPFWGQHASYSGGGYVLELPGSVDGQLAGLERIQNSGWIDDKTRVVFVEFTLFNPNVNCFTVLMLLFEYTNMGKVAPYHEIFTTNLYHYTSSYDIFLAVCECIFFVFNIAFTIIEVKRFLHLGRRNYFRDFWNLVELTQIILSFSVIGLFFQRLVAVGTIMDRYKLQTEKQFVSFYEALSWDIILSDVMAFLAAVVMLKAIKLLRLNTTTFMLIEALTFARRSVIALIALLVILAVAFGHATSISFGYLNWDYRNLGASMMSLFVFSLGEADNTSLKETNPVLGPMYFFFVFTFLWCFLAVFIAIVRFAITSTRDKFFLHENEYPLIDYIIRKYQRRY